MVGSTGPYQEYDLHPTIAWWHMLAANMHDAHTMQHYGSPIITAPLFPGEHLHPSPHPSPGEAPQNQLRMMADQGAPTPNRTGSVFASSQTSQG